MNVTIRHDEKLIHVMDRPPLTTRIELAGDTVLRCVKPDVVETRALRELLKSELGNAVGRLSRWELMRMTIVRVQSGRWSMRVVDVAQVHTHQGLVEGAGTPGGSGGKGGGSGSGTGAGKNPLENSTKTWVEVEFIDRNKRPVKGLRVEVTVPGGELVKGTLSDKGAFRKDNIDPGTCRVHFPDLDGREWAKSGSFPEGAAVEVIGPAPAIPAGPYKVKQGDHIASIAYDAGFLSWKTIWDDGKNAGIKKQRNPNVLYPGDVIEIPAKQKKEESAPTGEYHTFQAVGEPVMLKVVVLDWAGNPIADTDVEMQLDGKEKLKTAGDGSVKTNVNAGGEQEGSISLKGYTLDLKLGHMDPVEELSGQLARLNNLGYRAGGGTDGTSPAFLSAVEEFQCDYGLTVDGVCGPNTQAKLKDVHGS